MCRFRDLVTQIAGWLVLCTCGVAYAGTYDLRFPVNAGGVVSLHSGAALNDVSAADSLQVFVGSRNECCDGKYPVAGRYRRVSAHELSFKPAFDFVEDREYTIRVNPRVTGSESHLHEFVVVSSGSINTQPKVLSVYPNVAEIPDNTLRFYIYFSQPMKPHVSVRFIELRDAEGLPDEAAFMTFKQELWSEDRKRLTLLLDPGRIKRGVAQNLSLGPALQAGRNYSIVVNKGWPDARGTRTTHDFVKKYRVIKSLDTLPATAAWQVVVPSRGTREPLELLPDRTFDHVLFPDAISVLTSAGEVVAGSVAFNSVGNHWQFVPQNEWEIDEVVVSVDASLEDIAGNNFNELFDRPVGTEANSFDKQLLNLILNPPPGKAG